jgi:hypothetical protein
VAGEGILGDVIQSPAEVAGTVPHTAKAQAALDELAAKLGQSGWEPWGRWTDDVWFGLRFRRRAAGS